MEKKKLIDFANWILKSDWEPDFHQNMWEDYISDCITTEELIDIYLKEISNNQLPSQG